jgi:hypothetical protein
MAAEPERASGHPLVGVFPDERDAADRVVRLRSSMDRASDRLRQRRSVERPGTTPQLVEARAGGDPVQPRPQHRLVSEGAPSSPRPQERLLNEILGIVPVARHPVAVPPQLDPKRLDEPLEGLVVIPASRWRRDRPRMDGARWVAPPDVARLTVEADRTLSF